MLLKFIGFFRGPVLYVMEVAVIIALGMQDWLDAGIIIGILLLNAVVGWYQEKQAADVVASLKGDIAMKARVVRDGQETEIKARELVPGDIVSYTSWTLALPYEILTTTDHHRRGSRCCGRCPSHL